MKNLITRRSFVSVMAALAAAFRSAVGAPWAAAQPIRKVNARAASAGALWGGQESIQIDKHDVGEVLTGGRPYFPMLLGNGLEQVLIGYAGAMGACSGHEYWSYGTTSTGWFRPDIRHRPAYGALSLLQCSYIVLRGIYADSIARAEQVFVASDGVLISNCDLASSHVIVRTFLAKDGLLVHRFAVTPQANSMVMQFFVRRSSGQETLKVVAGLENVPAAEKQEPRVMTFKLVGEGLANTFGQLLCDHPKATMVTCYNGEAGIEVPLAGRSEFTFVVQCGAWEGPQRATGKLTPPDAFDFSASFNTHATEWRQFNSHSKVHIAKDAIDTVYRTSLYIIRSHQNPDMGGITVGGYPGMWWNDVDSYDVSYDLLALLGANRMREAELTVQFWQRIMPTLAQRASDANLPGVTCPGVLSPWGESGKKTRDQILEEGHFRTANIALHVWQLYQYCGRLTVLEKYWDCLVKPVEFLLGACVREYADYAEIIRSSGTDGKQRKNGKVVYPENPTITLVATIAAVRAVSEAAELLGRKPDPRWKLLLPKLEHGLNANRFGGVLREYRDPEAPPDGDTALCYLSLFNDCPTDEKTLSAGTKYYTGPEGLLRWPDQGERVIPWMHLRLSAALSRLGLPDAARMLEIGSQFTTTLNALPEGVCPDGAYTHPWYPTVHAAFVHALNLLMLCRRGDVVELFAGLPTEWGDASFESLRVPVGLVVSASRTRQMITAEATNDSELVQIVRFRASGQKTWEKIVSLEPCEKVALPF